MNWDAIGAVEDVVGGIAVLVTLIYLARQMRQNNALMKEQASYNSDKGVGFVGPPEAQPRGGVLAHFRDPDGNVLTLPGGGQAG